MGYVKTNIDGYVKDPTNGAIINTNDSEYISYKTKIGLALENRELKKRISTLEDDIQMIKEMLGKK
jgi:hypothetical protein